jgi:hypothetical protein
MKIFLFSNSRDIDHTSNTCVGCKNLKSKNFKQTMFEDFIFNIVLTIIMLTAGICFIVFRNNESSVFLYHDHARSFSGNFTGEQRTCSDVVTIENTSITSQFEIGYFMGIFCFVDALQYIIEIILWDFYIFYIAHNFGPIRWISYSISATIQLMGILFLCSILNVWHIIHISLETMLIMFTGLFCEYKNQIVPYIKIKSIYIPFWKIYSEEYKQSEIAVLNGKESSIPQQVLDVYFRVSFSWFWFGTVPFFLVWAHIFSQLGYSQSQQNLLWVVWTSISFLFTFQCLFAFNMYLNLQQLGPWKSYIFTNRCYKGLSLVAKLLPSFIIFFGTNSIKC